MRSARAVGGSLLFLVVAPGVVAGLVPWLLTGWDDAEGLGDVLVVRVLGGILLGAGIGILLDAFARFALEGRGTPAPVAPTERLVVGGLYRHVRNPMYLAVEAVIVGQALLLGQAILLAYATLVGAAFWGFVRWSEEPTLARRYGEAYEAYRRAVRAWRPRLRPWSPAGNVRDSLLQ